MDGVTDMPHTTALKHFDLFLQTYPVRILKNRQIGGITADYHCPLAGIAILITTGDEARRKALAAEGLTVLTISPAAIARNACEVQAFVEDTIHRALTTAN